MFCDSFINFVGIHALDYAVDWASNKVQREAEKWFEYVTRQQNGGFDDATTAPEIRAMTDEEGTTSPVSRSTTGVTVSASSAGRLSATVLGHEEKSTTVSVRDEF